MVFLEVDMVHKQDALVHDIVKPARQCSGCLSILSMQAFKGCWLDQPLS
jgi:hypothetical protein